MNRFILYLFVAIALPQFNRFQEVVTYQDAQVLFSSSLYGQKTGIIVCVSVGILLVLAFLRLRIRKQLSLWECLNVGVGLFALPALFNNWGISRYGAADVYTEVTAGIGGPMAGQLFFAAAFALIAAEAYFRANAARPPSARAVPVHL